MLNAMDDQPIFDYVNRLAKEEEELWHRAGDGQGLGAGERQRLDEITVALDQCYDLLHQRQAMRSAGQNPGEAHLRPPDIVEHYEQ